MTFLHTAAKFVTTMLISAHLISIPVQNLGATIPLTPALYSGYLVSGISKTDQTITLSTGVDRSGNTLSGYYCFTLDVNTPNVEYVCGTVAGTAVTAINRGVDLSNPNTTSTGNTHTHNRFGTVDITDYPTIQFVQRKLNGTDSFDNPLKYASSSVTSVLLQTDTGNIASVGYVNSVASSGAANAQLTVNGISQLATSAQIASGTVQGSTGANLVIPASSASATSSAAGILPVVGVTGKLSQIFTDYTASNTWSGLNTFNGGTNLTSSTINGTTTFRAGLDFNSSTIIASPFSQLLDATSTAVSSLSSTATTTLARLTIPANTLRGVNTIKGTMYLSNVTNVSTNDNIKVNMSYGDTATTSAIITFTSTAQAGKGRVGFTLSAGGATNAQFGNLTFETWQQAPGASSTMANNNAAGTAQTNSTWAVDATTVKQLVISTTNSQNNSSLGIQMTSYIVEKILNL